MKYGEINLIDFMAKNYIEISLDMQTCQMFQGQQYCRDWLSSSPPLFQGWALFLKCRCAWTPWCNC